MGAEGGLTRTFPFRRQEAFTLIELLVVVAIIALLLSILMPSLSKARAQARSAACASNIRQICSAEALYQSEQAGWIPGSPLTTGYFFTKTGFASWNPKIPRFNRFILEWFDYSTPLRALMQGPKTIPRPAGPSPRDAEVTQKILWLKATDEPFHCPSNPHLARPWSGDVLDGWPTPRATSYLTMSTIMRAGPAICDEAKTIYRSTLDPTDIAQSRHWELAPPEDYVPRHSRVGRESMKVFIADGLRFYDGDDNPLTINVKTADTLGAMTGTPPSTFWPYGREYNSARLYSYRHGNNNRINAGFFDGHAESLLVQHGPEPTRFTGKAIHPRWYYPSGTLVKDPQGVHKNTIAPDTKLP